MTQEGERSTEGVAASQSDSPTADALENLRSLIFGSNPGRGAVREAAKEAGVKRNPFQRAISPQAIEQVRKVEEELRGGSNG